MFDFLHSEVQPIMVEVDDAVLAANKKVSSGLNQLVGSIDQGTSSTRFLVFTTGGKIAAWAQMEHKQLFLEGEDKVRSAWQVVTQILSNNF